MFPSHKVDTIETAGKIFQDFRVSSRQNGTASVDERDHVFFSLLPSWDEPNVKHVHPFLPLWPIFLYMLSAMACLLFSTFFHTFSAVSIRVADNFQSLDYAGICLLIAGSTVPVIYYGFYCQPALQVFYMTINMTLGCAGCIVSVVPTFRAIKYREARVVMFIFMGASGGFPLIHMMILNGSFHWLVFYILAMGAMYLTGAAIYAFQVPERWLPGKFDILGSSHQLWHVFIFLAVCTHYVGLRKFYFWRMSQAC
jgi:adiponectin receptor